jgi:hypothetical protein
MDRLIQALHDLFVRRSPALPEHVKEWIVRYGPWITIALIILFLPSLLFLLRVSAAISPFAPAAGPAATSGLALAWLFLAVSLGLEVAALPGLFHRRMQGWNLLFYATLLTAAYNLLALNLFGLVFGAAISLYVLMQIRSKYT